MLDNVQIINEVDGYIKEKNGNEYLIFNSADKNKEVLKKYTERWNGIKNEIETINGSKKVSSVPLNMVKTS